MSLQKPRSLQKLALWSAIAVLGAGSFAATAQDTTPAPAATGTTAAPAPAPHKKKHISHHKAACPAGQQMVDAKCQPPEPTPPPVKPPGDSN